MRALQLHITSLLVFRNEGTQLTLPQSLSHINDER